MTIPVDINAWDDPDFVASWNETYGLDMSNAPIRPGIVYPWIERQVGDFSDKKLIDIGCGNGNLIHHFRQANFHHWYGIDPGREIIKSAKGHITDQRVTFSHINPAEEDYISRQGQDYDVATGVFVLEEIPNEGFQHFCNSISSILKPDGSLLLFSNHPINIAREDLLRRIDSAHPVKFEGLEGYYDSRSSLYSLSVLNQNNNFEKKAPHHQKTLATIINCFSKANLHIQDMIEVPCGVVTMKQLEGHQPRTEDMPRFLGLSLQKT